MKYRKSYFRKIKNLDNQGLNHYGSGRRYRKSKDHQAVRCKNDGNLSNTPLHLKKGSWCIYLSDFRTWIIQTDINRHLSTTNNLES